MFTDLTITDLTVFDDTLRESEISLNNIGDTELSFNNIINDVCQNYFDDISSTYYDINASILNYDEKRDEMSEKIEINKIKSEKNQKNIELEHSPTYTLFMVWIFIFFILFFVLGMHIIEDVTQLNSYTKTIIGLFLVFIIYLFFMNLYHILSRHE